jgi:hypothetical protein
LLYRVGSSPSDDSLCLVNADLASSIEINSYPEQSRQSIDLMESEVVEFTRCAPFKTWLNDGRLWFDEQTSYGKKSAAFLKWANSLPRWIRNNYKRDARGYFIGPHALKLLQAGKLQLGPPTEPELSLEERKHILGLK